MSSSWTLPVEEHSADSARFDFFIRIVPNEEIFLVEAYRKDTVDATVNRITTKKNISGSKQQRLVYGGRQLQKEQCLGDCCIEKNSLLYLLGPQYANAWPAVDSIVETACSVYRGEIGPAEITQKLSRFFDLIPWHNDKAVVEYLQLFSSSSVPVVLGMLYSSSTKGIEEFAKESIYSFLTKCRDVPSTARSHILPAVVELCRLLKKVRPDKKLYLSCWNLFVSMLESVDSFHCKAMQLFITRALLSFSMDIALLLRTSISADLGYVAVFEELVGGIGKALEDSLMLCSEYLTALEYVNSLSSSLQKCAKEELMAVLMSRQTTLCTLIVRFAKRGVDYQWLNEFKEVTNFEARRHLAMLMLPDVDHSHLRKNFIIPASNLLVESSRQIRDASPESLQHGISVKFELEPGSGEGVTREWFQLASKATFSSDEIPSSPFYAPYTDRRFSPNPGFMEYEMFEFAGRLLGLALMHDTQLNVFFDRVFFLQLAGAEIGLDDIKKTEPILYNSLKNMLEGRQTNYDDLSFEIEFERGGKVCSEELCQDGKSVAVTSANVEEYTDLYVKHRFVKVISEQTSLFAKGFTDLLLGSISHKAFFQTLCLKDFDLMFGGEEIGIRMEDWKAHTIYGFGFEDTDEEIDWFWNIVEEMTEERQRNLLKFWTAIASLPHGGILALPRKLEILKIYTDYPLSSTCFYRLKLPAYKTFEEMKTGLELVSDDDHCIGFGMD